MKEMSYYRERVWFLGIPWLTTKATEGLTLTVSCNEQDGKQECTITKTRLDLLG